MTPEHTQTNLAVGARRGELWGTALDWAGGEAGRLTNSGVHERPTGGTYLQRCSRALMLLACRSYSGSIIEKKVVALFDLGPQYGSI